MTRRYSQFNTFTTYYYYDANGARIKQQDDNSGDTTYFDYYANQMIKKITPPAGPAAAWEFGYDGQLNRHYIDAAGSPAYYLWDGLNCLEKRKATTGLLQARYTSVAAPIYGIGSYGEILVPGAPDKAYTPVMDHRGTVVAVLDGTQKVIATRDYNAYGEILAETGSWPIEEGYQSNWKTVTIGNKKWCLSAARVYDPQTGVFGQRDPSRDGMNLYQYASQSTLQKVDPAGLATSNEASEARGSMLSLVSPAVLPPYFSGNSMPFTSLRPDKDSLLNTTLLLKSLEREAQPKIYSFASVARASSGNAVLGVTGLVIIPGLYIGDCNYGCKNTGIGRNPAAHWFDSPLIKWRCWYRCAFFAVLILRRSYLPSFFGDALCARKLSKTNSQKENC